MSTVRSEDLACALTVRRHPRARRMRLRYDATEDKVLLTVPPGISESKALSWARGQQEWIDRQRRERPAGTPLTSGSIIPYEDGELQLEHRPGLPRRLERRGEMLVGGGPLEAFPNRVERWLKVAARDRLAEDVAFYAARAGVTVARVTVGNAKTRWGSCSGEGILRFNWRLICAPSQVRRYVAAHEVAHRIHMNHGPDFHRLEKELFGQSTREAQQLLRRLGPGLQRIGR